MQGGQTDAHLNILHGPVTRLGFHPQEAIEAMRRCLVALERTRDELGKGSIIHDVEQCGEALGHRERCPRAVAEHR